MSGQKSLDNEKFTENIKSLEKIIRNQRIMKF